LGSWERKDAGSLGISPYTLHNWVKLDRERDSQSGVLNDSEREELARLREQKAAVDGLSLAFNPYFGGGF